MLTELQFEFIYVNFQVILKRVGSLTATGQPSAIKDHRELTFTPTLHNGEYSFTLSSSNGMISGAYILSIHNLGVATQSIRVSNKIVNTVRAIAIRPSQKLTSKNSQNEFSYFRFHRSNPSALVSIRARPLLDERGPIGDPDVFVTNRHDGLVGVNKENWIWKSTNVGSDRIDIHPSDVDASRGSTFIIGVLGYKERNEFEIEVRIEE